jgi:hypothetical protein
MPYASALCLMPLPCAYRIAEAERFEAQARAEASAAAAAGADQERSIAEVCSKLGSVSSKLASASSKLARNADKRLLSHHQEPAYHFELWRHMPYGLQKHYRH